MRKGLLPAGVFAGLVLAGGLASAQERGHRFDPAIPPAIFTLGLRANPFVRLVVVRDETPAQTVPPADYRDLDVQIDRLGELIRRDQEK